MYMPSLQKRQSTTTTVNCVNSFGDSIPCYSVWYLWGRWVALAVALIAFFVLFTLLSRASARRRRTLGLTPYYGTGWLYYNGPTNPPPGTVTYAGSYGGYGGYPIQQQGPQYIQPPPQYQPQQEQPYQKTPELGAGLSAPQPTYQKEGK